MNNIIKKTHTNKFIKGGKLKSILYAFTLSAILTGCASTNQKEESIEDILGKENELIGKVQAERATPEVQQGVTQNVCLKNSEEHLSLALQELLKANEVITMRLIQQNRKEVNFDRFNGHNHSIW